MTKTAINSANLSLETISNQLHSELIFSQNVARTGMIPSQQTNCSSMPTSERENREAPFAENMNPFAVANSSQGHQLVSHHLEVKSQEGVLSMPHSRVPFMNVL